MEKSSFSVATPYKESNMGTFGKASSMLISQFQFPLSFDYDKDKFTTAYLDQLKGQDESHVKNCFRNYGVNERSLETELRGSDGELILKFLSDLLGVSNEVWTGYRVLGYVWSGYPYYCFQLFSKSPESSTEVYSGDEAPNVSKT